jgi:hypothetical protein
VAPPEEKARPLDPARLEKADVLFCTYPPTNFSDMRAVKWGQIASTGYKQLYEHKLHDRGIRATNAHGCFDARLPWPIGSLRRQGNYRKDRDRSNYMSGPSLAGTPLRPEQRNAPRSGSANKYQMTILLS